MMNAPHLHHQWFPDERRFEGLSEHSTAVALENLGHRLTIGRQGDAHSIWINPKTGG